MMSLQLKSDVLCFGVMQEGLSALNVREHDATHHSRTGIVTVFTCGFWHSC